MLANTITRWPLQVECGAFYGDPRGANGAPNGQWERNNLAAITPPFQMSYAGQKISTIRIHRKCAESLTRVLNTIWTVSGHNQRLIDEWGASTFGGSYNYRLMRGLNTLSMHAYGCAIDLDPARNGLQDRTPHFTPGCPVVQAFLTEGWTWGGDWDGDHSTADEPRCDGMHFQAARVK